MLWLIISAVILAADQTIKYFIETNIAMGEKVTVIKDFFYITYHTNTGAAHGILQNGNFIFIPVTIIAVIAIIYFILKRKEKFLKAVLAVLLGGALGNLADRIFKGAVTDYLDFYFGSYNYPTFNIADSCIFVSAILLVIFILFIYKEPGDNKNVSRK